MTNEQTAVLISQYMERLLDEINRLMDGESRPKTDAHVAFLVKIFESMESDKGNLISRISWASTQDIPWRKP